MFVLISFIGRGQNVEEVSVFNEDHKVDLNVNKDLY